MARRFAPRRPWQAYDFILDILVRPAILGFVKCCGPSDRLTKFGPAEISADGAVRFKTLWYGGGSVRYLWLMSSARMEFRMFYWDTVVTNRASARQYFVKVMPRDFVG